MCGVPADHGAGQEGGQHLLEDVSSWQQRSATQAQVSIIDVGLHRFSLRSSKLWLSVEICAPTKITQTKLVMHITVCTICSMMIGAALNSMHYLLNAHYLLNDRRMHHHIKIDLGQKLKVTLKVDPVYGKHFWNQIPI